MDTNLTMDATPTIKFPALRGTMGKRQYYSTMFKLSLVPKLFKFKDYSELTPEQRAQRILNVKRVPEITRYILEHEDGWLFSSLTASFNGDERFIPVSENTPDVGVLEMPLDTEFLINDGQHRRAAIEEAVRQNPYLAHESISVVLFPDESLERSQQMFSDLNRTVQKTSRSLDILYDQRDVLNQVTLTVAERVALFRGRVEKDKVSVAARSPKFITLSGLYDANITLLGKLPESTPEEDLQEYERIATQYWEAVTDSIPEWKQIRDGELKPAEARAEYIHSSTVVFWALGTVGRHLLADFPDDWKAVLEGLSDIDWRRTNREWQGIAMLGFDVVSRRQSREATAEFIAWKLGLRDQEPIRVLGNEVA